MPKRTRLYPFSLRYIQSHSGSLVCIAMLKAVSVGSSEKDNLGSRSTSTKYAEAFVERSALSSVTSICATRHHWVKFSPMPYIGTNTGRPDELGFRATMVRDVSILY